MYPGIKLPRVQGKEYEEFIEEFMQAVTHKWGKQVLIQFEDFGNHNAFKVLDTLLRFSFIFVVTAKVQESIFDLQR